MNDKTMDKIILHLKDIKVLCDECPKEEYCEGFFLECFDTTNSIKEVIESLLYERHGNEWRSEK